jgi:signal transduction histidine kinase
LGHELRTPQSTIIGYSEMILEDHKEQELELDAETIDRITRINSAGKHLLSVANDILDFVKIITNKYSPVLETFKVSDLIPSNRLMFFHQRPTEVETSFDPNVGEVYSDKRFIHDVLYVVFRIAAMASVDNKISVHVTYETIGNVDYVIFRVNPIGIISTSRLDHEYGGRLDWALAKHRCEVLRGTLDAIYNDNRLEIVFRLPTRL